jgi:hypothetical protein
MEPLRSEEGIRQEIRSIISTIESNRSAQGHICINDSDLFDISVNDGVYGFPGQGNTALNNLGVTAWRAISSLYNIGPEDLILLYRTSGQALGGQEFHGIFRVSKSGTTPMLLLHCNDKTFLPLREGRQYLPFRFLFERLTSSPVSIPNDLRNKTDRKNNNLEIIKALSETDPDKPRLWGFRHPAVMNIGAARKSSIKAISHNQLVFFLHILLSTAAERQTNPALVGKRYDPNNLPKDCVLLDDKFIADRLVEHGIAARSFENEAEIYAYIIGALRNPHSRFHSKLCEDFCKINADLPFDRISENVLLEVVITPHIQEEIDILLCDSKEQNFLIMEVKNDELNAEDIEQAEKYIQLVDQRFPGSQSISANVIGLRNRALRSTKTVKLVSYEIEEIDSTASVSFRPN